MYHRFQEAVLLSLPQVLSVDASLRLWDIRHLNKPISGPTWKREAPSPNEPHQVCPLASVKGLETRQN